jgi:tRNA-dihydrouridine synthase B
MLVEAARYNVDRGAQIIDVNMGCPAKKVCSVACGSALLRDTDLVARILDAVVRAVDVPVTLKYRTGWDVSRRNAVEVARLAEAAGVAALTLHGRTRACGFGVRRSTRPSGYQAGGENPGDRQWRHRYTAEGASGSGADAGRWRDDRPSGPGTAGIFREIVHYLATGEELPPPGVDEARTLLLGHLDRHYSFYGMELGVRTARKHIIWYTRQLVDGRAFCDEMNAGRLHSCGAL